jgi:hypothetical protein
MLSLISLLLSFLPKKKIIQVRRLPAVKRLQAHPLGLTIGFFFVLLNLVFHFSLSSIWPSLAILFWFLLVTYFGSILFILTLLVTLLIYFSPALTIPIFIINATWFFTGYLAGAVLAIFYNDLVYLFIHICERKRIKIVFAYDTGKRVNVIKCPVKEDEHAFQDLFADKPGLKDRKLYKYKNMNASKRPYTVLFIANPKILKRLPLAGDLLKAEKIKKLQEHREKESSYVTDPILCDRELFLRSVEKGLFSFDHNEILGRPEVWSQVRVITVFDDSLAGESGVGHGLIGEFQEDIYTSASPSEPIDNNLLDPLKEMKRNVENILARICKTSGDIVEQHIIKTILENPVDDKKKQLKNVDVIYGLSASPTHDRSTAHYTDWMEIEDEDQDNRIIPNRKGKPFSFDYDPCQNKKLKEVDQNGKVTTGESTILVPKFNKETQLELVHEYDAKYPGRIALNVISAGDYTYIHEFSHAMSNVYHGAIVDEYVDYFAFEADEKKNQIQNPEAWFYVNRVDRNRKLMMDKGIIIPIDKVFARYNCVDYYSDLAHPSAEEGWSGYFPERNPVSTTCMMDGPSWICRFDQLLRTFIYDRMMAKFVRK